MEENENKKEYLTNTNVSVIENIEATEKKQEKEQLENLEPEVKDEIYNCNGKNKSKIGMILVIMVILIIILALFSTIFAVINTGNEKIIKGIYIAEIDVSNLTQEEAKKMIEEIYSQKEENEINLIYGEFEETMTYKTLEVEYQIDEAVKNAYEVGRKGNLFKDNYNIIKSFFKGIQIELNVVFDQEMFEQIVQNINNNIEGAVIQPSYYIKDDEDKLIITTGKEGLQVRKEELYQKIYKIVKEQAEPDEIQIPLETVKPNEIDIERIHEEIYKEVKDAYYTKEPFTIYPEVKGIDFDVENAKNILIEEKEEYEVPLIITKPSKTTREIGTEAFPDLLSTFSTKYQASNVNRTTNLRLAANKINGTVLLPGEEFSYNKTVGERTKAAGFKEAAIFNAGKVENGLGGGICQISSTLYDAIIIANLQATVRRNHQFVTSYVKAGADATVVWGSQDFKFKNTRKYPVRITATVQGGIATVQVWGVKEETEYEITIETKKIATIPYATQYIQTANLPAGQQKVIQTGSNGQKVEAYKVTRLNGQIISKTLLSKDTYNAMKKIVHVGIGQ